MQPRARILIVEDERMLADNLKVFLGRCSFEVRVAHDAATAMKLLESYAPNLVILDYGLPGIDGLRAYAEIVRASARRPPCVMITGYLTARMVEQAQAQGIRHVLCKPFSLTDLQHLVNLAGEEMAGDPTAAACPAPAGRGLFLSCKQRCLEQQCQQFQRDALDAAP